MEGKGLGMEEKGERKRHLAPPARVDRAHGVRPCATHVTRATLERAG